MPTLTALQNPVDNGQSQGLKILYPYDKTVFPRGLIAPLLQWAWAPGDADAIQIQLTTTSGSFKWTGTFGRPTVLSMMGAPNTKFIRNPIPQDVWNVATNSAGGLTSNAMPDQLTMSLVVARGGMAHGPVSETWTIAPGRLEGTVYYNSYGTRLIANSNFYTKDGVLSGAAVLGINEGALAPVVVAGLPAKNATDQSGTGCRVCHVVSSGGSTLIVEHGDNYGETSYYNLQNANPNGTETVLYDQWKFGWAGLSTDGTLALTNSADLAAGTADMQLYTFPTPVQGAGAGAQALASNIPTGVKGGTPAFSPDTKHVAFELINGTILGTQANANQPQLIALDFDRATNQFSNLKVLATMPSGMRAGFPSFFPTNDAVAFHYQMVNAGHRYNTWSPATAQIWWSDLATGNATNLSALNGLAGTTSYLPTGGNNHGDDTKFNYEPTVNPISSGGYIWVIFTSRRLYGNVATADPYQSDPRHYDDSLLVNATTKKLWVAAIDLNAKPGTDASHPAFYLPAQELLAGNSRGFWVLNPCKADGLGCMSGDECCNGYCEPNPDGGGLVCANATPNNTCSMLQEKCTTAADCCDMSNLCINGFCVLATAK
jgi:hypothetical protein